MNSQAKPKRKRLNANERRERKAAEIQIFAKNYARKTNASAPDPNDRRYARETVDMVRHMRPDELDRLLRNGEE
jgi:hypothetical protein